MIPAIRAEIRDYLYKDVALEDFSILPQTILAARWTMDKISFYEYENVLDNRLKEPDLHPCAILHHHF